ncbi:MAG: YdeI/OmpD-associated family protein [bacterium]|nr:YdeI/OmpD-associated family protein [bacterium]
MHSFKSIILKFASKAEKTGWTYVDVPQDIILKLKLKNKKEFRIKGMMDDFRFERLVCYPAGEGKFIVAINGELRKKLGKKEGAMLSIKFELDKSEALKSQELVDCLAEDLIAKKQFESLNLSHQNYFHRYIFTAKGADTKAGRIENVINALYQKQNFGEMIRGLKKEIK